MEKREKRGGSEGEGRKAEMRDTKEGKEGRRQANDPTLALLHPSLTHTPHHTHKNQTNAHAEKTNELCAVYLC